MQAAGGTAASAPQDPPPEAGLRCDFVGGAVGHRHRFGGGRGQSLPKAVGLRPGRRPRVVDATAGLGRDAFLLASLGLDVTLIERSAAIHALLREGLAHARAAGPGLSAIVDRMTLIHGDARELLPGLHPEVVLVDPMHPPRRNSALVKKEMRLVRAVVGLDADARDLVEVALASASDRVVLKWPLRGDPLPGLPPPHHSLRSKTLRYDVFMIHGPPS